MIHKFEIIDYQEMVEGFNDHLTKGDRVMVGMNFPKSFDMLLALATRNRAELGKAQQVAFSKPELLMRLKFSSIADVQAAYVKAVLTGTANWKERKSAVMTLSTRESWKEDAATLQKFLGDDIDVFIYIPHQLVKMWEGM